MLDMVLNRSNIGTATFNPLENIMSIKTMIVTAIAFWAYVGLCLYVMGKLAGVI